MGITNNEQLTPTPKYFKIGDKKYGIDDFLKMHGEQQLHYINFLKDNYGFTTDEAKEAMTTLMSQLRDDITQGKSFTADGYLITGDNLFDNSVYSVKTKGINKRANARTAMQKYLLTLEKHLKEYEEPVDDNAWDINKHGFNQHLIDQGYEPEEIFANYDRGSADYSKDRGFTERNNILTKELLDYYNELLTKNYSGEEYNTYKSRLDEFFKTVYDNTGNLYKVNASFKGGIDIADELRLLGLNENFIKGFTSDLYQGDKTNQQLHDEYLQKLSEKQRQDAELELLNYQLELQRTQLELAQSALQLAKAEKAANDLDAKYQQRLLQEITTADDYLYTEYNKLNPYSDSILVFNIPENFGSLKEYYINLGGKKDRFKKQFENLYGISYINFNDDLFLASYNNLIKFLNGIEKTYSSESNLDKSIVLLLLAENSSNPINSKLITDIGNGKYILNETINKDVGAAILYDQNTKTLQRVYLGDSLFNNTPVEERFRQIIYDIIKSKNINNEELPSSYYTIDRLRILKKGGNIIPRFQEGLKIYSGEYTPLKSTKDMNKYYKQVEQGRTVSDDFTGNDYVLLGTIAADLTGLILGPLSGAAVGAVSSTTNFINEWNRDGLLWRDVLDYGINLGLDAVGMVPVIGDILGEGSKIARAINKLGPKVLKAMQWFSTGAGLASTGLTLLESEEIYKSFEKVLTSPKNMTVADWQNVSRGINLIVAGKRGAQHAANMRRTKKAVEGADDIVVKVENNEGEQKFVTLSGENAKKVKQFSSERNPDKINELINGIDGGQGFKIIENKPVIKHGLQWIRKDGLWQKPIYTRNGEAHISLTPDEFIKQYNKQTWYNRPFISNVNTGYTARLLRNQNDITVNLTNPYTLDLLTAIKDLEKDLGFEDLAKKLKKDIDNLPKRKERASKEFKRLKKESKKFLRDNDFVEDLNLSKVRKILKYRKQRLDPEKVVESTQNLYALGVTPGDDYTKEFKYLDLLQKMKRNKTISMRNIEDLPSYKRFKKAVESADTLNLGFDFKFDFDKIVKQYRQKGLLKQGGVINRNNFNKFLNYGKR